MALQSASSGLGRSPKASSVLRPVVNLPLLFVPAGAEGDGPSRVVVLTRRGRVARAGELRVSIRPPLVRRAAPVSTLRAVSWTPSRDDTPFERIGGETPVRALAATFYDLMDAEEPALARLHELDEHGRVARGPRERFALFLVEWLGGPRTYSSLHGHPRLRMRHARVRIDEAMRDAWVRCMTRAMERSEVPPEARAYLERRFFEVADFLRNA